jgi:adenylate kinase
LLRDAVARGTELGQLAKAAMNAGQLVSDDIVLGLIRERLSRSDAAAGFILDGYPRNSDQATALNSLLADLGQPISAVLLLEVKRNTLIQRLAGRRVCPKCGKVFNVASLPAGLAQCDNCADHPTLIQRPDDKEDVITKRLEVYEAQTRPLIEHYKRLGLLRAIAGEGELDKVFARMESAALGQQPKVKAAKKPAPAKPVAAVATAQQPVAQAQAVKKQPAKKKAAAKKPAKAKAKAAKQPAQKASRKNKSAAKKKPVGKKPVGKKKAAKKKK